MDRRFGSFIWDVRKEASNIRKHGVNFETAAKAFKDPARKIFADEKHAETEERLFCIGKVDDKILTIRFTYRGGLISIYGAGCWRKGGGVDYANEKFVSAVYGLATGPGDVRSRLLIAHLSFHPVRESDLPEHLRADYA